MGKYNNFLITILRGESDKNISFDGLRNLLIHLGFEERIRGSHHMFRMSGVYEKINLQNEGGKAKAYQVRQVRNVIVKYNLAGG